jgi:hypothetical protein
VSPRSGFKRVPGNLNAGTVGKPLYLWYMKASYDSDTYQVGRNRAPEDVKRSVCLPSLSCVHGVFVTGRHSLRSGLEARLRSLLRSYAQKLAGAQSDAASVASGGTSASRKSLDFAAVFERLCGRPGTASAHQQLTKRMFQTYLVDEVGLFVPKDYSLYLWNRLDTNHDGLVSLKEFEDFVSMDAFELAGKVKEVLDATSIAMDGGMTLNQLFGPFEAPRPSRPSREPVEDYVTENAFVAALGRMRVNLSHQERGQLLTAFGFREDGLLATRTLAQMIEDHRARRSRVRWFSFVSLPHIAVMTSFAVSGGPCGGQSSRRAQRRGFRWQSTKIDARTKRCCEYREFRGGVGCFNSCPYWESFRCDERSVAKVFGCQMWPGPS